VAYLNANIESLPKRGPVSKYSLPAEVRARQSREEGEFC